MGYSEGSSQTPTLNINKLAWSGIILNRYYTYHLCTPSRAAILTGKYAIHTGEAYPLTLVFATREDIFFLAGLQNYVIGHGRATALPLEEHIQPEYLKRLGYQTFLVGKVRHKCHLHIIFYSLLPLIVTTKFLVASGSSYPSTFPS